jgi:predicted dehydrogenase
MKIGIIGLGYWGPNLIRNFIERVEIEKVVGCDLNEDRLRLMKLKFPSINITNNYKNLLNSDLDAIIIATPVASHYPLAKEALLAGKHIWVEKPFTSRSDQAYDLIETANSRGLNIFVDHTFIYTGAIKKMKELIDSDELGDIIYFDSVRVNLGLFQQDVNVTWDLAPHDLSIMNYLLKDYKVSAVKADGIATYYNHENIAHISVYFEDESCFAHFHVNWTSPVKIRKTIIAGTKKMLIYDDMENFEKIKVYDCGVEFFKSEGMNNARIQYRVGDMYSPKILQTEALSLAAKEFIDSINEKRKPLTNGFEGLGVVRILEAAEKSIKDRGKLVELVPEIKQLKLFVK